MLAAHRMCNVLDIGQAVIHSHPVARPADRAAQERRDRRRSPEGCAVLARTKPGVQVRYHAGLAAAATAEWVAGQGTLAAIS
jgi:hypothetical protein